MKKPIRTGGGTGCIIPGGGTGCIGDGGTASAGIDDVAI